MRVWVRVGGREGSTQIIQLCERVGSCGREGGIDADKTTMCACGFVWEGGRDRRR